MSTQKSYSEQTRAANMMDAHTPQSLPGFTPSTQKRITEDQLVLKLKKLMKINLKNCCYQDAIFFADKILHIQQSKSDKLVKAVYALAHCYLLNKEYLRCVQLIEKFELAFHHEKFRILTAQALFLSNNINACINVLQKDLVSEQDLAGALGGTSVSYMSHESFDSHEKEEYYKGLRFLILAKAYEAQENKVYAVQYYQDALRHNAENFEAFDRLVSNYLLTQEEKVQLIDKLKFSQENLWLKDYYISRIEQQLREKTEGMILMSLYSHNNTSVHNNVDESGISPSRFQHDLENEDPNDTLRNPNTGVSPAGLQQQQLQQQHLLNPMVPPQMTEVSVLELLSNRESFDIRQIEAEKLFNDQNYVKAYEIIKAIVDEDFYFLNIVPLFCAVLIELSKIGELYYLAHKLVSANPDLAVSWFSVGSYYFLIKKYDLARKYFNKANRIDKHFAASWIAFGHSFAAQDESDQAMAAYRTAARLFPGCHLAHLFIGMEYLRTNNLKTALLSFNESQKINDKDPLVFNEIGVVHYKQALYDNAKEFFAIALSLCKETNCKTYETILINLAHCNRKLKDLTSAVELYEKCLTINPKNPSTHTSLGYSYHLKGEFRQALNCYHKASFLKNEDQLVNELINRALNDINEFPIDEVYLKGP